MAISKDFSPPQELWSHADPEPTAPTSSSAIDNRVDQLLQSPDKHMYELLPNIDALAFVHLDGRAWFPDGVPQLTRRTRNVLARYGVLDVGGLANLRLIDILQWRQFGAVGARDLLRTLIALLHHQDVVARNNQSHRGNGEPVGSAVESESPDEDRAGVVGGDLGVASTPHELRNARIVEMRESGMTLAEIAAQAGITRERVRQICKRNGARSSQERRSEANESRRRQDEQLVARISQVLVKQPGMTYSELATACGEAELRVKRLVPRNLLRLVFHERQSRDGASRLWTNEEILAAIRTAATYEYPLTSAKYTNLLEVGEIRGPSIARIHQIFGGWSRACQKAGVEHGNSAIEYTSRWTDDDILRFVVMYLHDAEFTGSLEGYSTWRTMKRDDAPSGGILRSRIGDWTMVKETAFLKMRMTPDLGNIPDVE